MKRKITYLYSFIIVAVVGCTYDKADAPAPTSDVTFTDLSYRNDIAPIISNYCVSCHNGTMYGADDLTNYNLLKLKVDNGTFKNRVLVAKDMPMYCDITQLEHDKINAWLNSGAVE